MEDIGEGTDLKEENDLDIAQKLHELFTESELQDDCVSFPNWGILVRPQINKLTDNTAQLSFNISSPEWDSEMFETSVGMGDSQENAINMALGSFVFGMMDGIKHMMKDKGYACGQCTCETQTNEIDAEFAGARRHWRVYESNLVVMGNRPKNTETVAYWRMIADAIKQRLGNQKICYVKIYTARIGDNVTSECRINDIMSPEISEQLAEYVKTWDIEGFGSQKQFFFLVQDENTSSPYPYTPAQIADCVKQAISLFESCETDEAYEDFVETLAQRIGDRDLALELYMFLPEMCAETAFDSIDYGEQISICCGGVQEKVYKTQLASYYPIFSALHAEFAAGRFANDLYRKYISVSSIYNVISQAKSKGTDLTKGGKIHISFGADEAYTLR
ncbi:MAG: DUF6348 family protein [Peptococcaceae bacterium]|nr:DUF6348 family protein [Peptococcaceae bacterium]